MNELVNLLSRRVEAFPKSTRRTLSLSVVCAFESSFALLSWCQTSGNPQSGDDSERRRLKHKSAYVASGNRVERRRLPGAVGLRITDARTFSLSRGISFDVFSQVFIIVREWDRRYQRATGGLVSDSWPC